MSFNEELALRIRDQINSLGSNHFTEKKMFGGLAFLYKGKMTVGITNDDLMVRVVSEKMDDLLSKPYVRPMDFTKKPMKEFIFVDSDGWHTERDLSEWIELGIEHANRKLNES